MEAAKHNVFAQQTIGGKTLLEMTRHDEQAVSVCVANPLRTPNADTLLTKPRLRQLAMNH